MAQGENDFAQWRARVSWSTANQTLEFADVTLDLARKSGDAPFPACIAIVAAAALTQGIETCIDWLCTEEGHAMGVPPEDTMAAGILSMSLRQRMTRLPAVLSEGVFELDPEAKAVRCLHSLIGVRNRLMHIRERTVVVRGDAIGGDATGVSVRIPTPPPNPWRTVSLGEAEAYVVAVREYLERIALSSDDLRFHTPMVRRVR